MNEPGLSLEDRIAGYELIALHGHLVDDGRLDELDRIFSADLKYDLFAFGGGALEGIAAIRGAALMLGARNPVAHHVTNMVVASKSDRGVRVIAKEIGVMGDGASGRVTYDDWIVRTEHGWRLAERRVLPRKIALGRVV